MQSHSRRSTAARSPETSRPKSITPRVYLAFASGSMAPFDARRQRKDAPNPAATRRHRDDVEGTTMEGLLAITLIGSLGFPRAVRRADRIRLTPPRIRVTLTMVLVRSGWCFAV